MQTRPFALERYFARYESTSRYHLSSSECEGDSMAQLLEGADDECRDLWSSLTLGYTEYGGLPLLREAVAGLYESLDAADVNVLVPLEGILLSMHAALSPGDHVVCMFPGYQALYEVAASIGCDVDRWTPRETDHWHFDLDDLRELLKPETAMLVVNVPHNPTGAVFTSQEWDAMLELCEQRGIRIFCDEMYRGLEHDGVAQTTSVVDRHPNAIALGGVSKSHGLPGLRIGWVASRDTEFMKRFSQLRDYTTMCNSAPSELLALMAIRNQATLFKRHRDRVHSHLDHLTAFIAEHAGKLEMRRPQGSTVCLVRVLEDSAEELARRCAQEHGLMLVPSTVFEFGDHHIRIGMGLRNFTECLGVFGRILRGERTA
ncbi:MAG: aminotransferase class I/II-fold pyridoxal phosphate-dependent enzyme [Phycisphaerales bacterium]|nr:aminotransferase class I/II-fold pyridoxal phosphate-dependent enzyme [Phycisphaerales bacterium]